MSKRLEPVSLREEALAPSPLSAMQTTLRELTQGLASMKQEMSTFKQNMAHLCKGENLLGRNLDEDRNVGDVDAFGPLLN